MTTINKPMTEKQMWHEIMEDMRHIRARLDDLKEEVTKVRVGMEGNRVRWAIMTATVSTCTAGLVAWLFNKMQ